jgi:hypothetical protein
MDRFANNYWLWTAGGVLVSLGAAGAVYFYLKQQSSEGAPSPPGPGSPLARSPKAALEAAVASFLCTSDVSELAKRVRELPVAGYAVEGLGSTSPTSTPSTPTAPAGFGGGGISPTAAAASGRVFVSSELVKVCAYAACVRGEEDGERLCSALVQLAWLGVLSPPGLEHGLRIMAARLSDVVLDHPSALVHLTGFSAWLAQSEVVSERCFEEAHLTPGDLRATLSGSSVPDAGVARAGLHSLATSLATRLRSRAPTQLSQLRTMYQEAVDAYIASGGGAYELLLDSLGTMHARWTLHELVRKLCHAFLDPPYGTPAMAEAAGAEDLYTSVGGSLTEAPAAPSSGAAGVCLDTPALPSWLVREVVVDLLISLVEDGHVDTAAVTAGCEATLRELPELALDVPAAPVLFGTLLARLVAEGALPCDYLTGKHASLSGLTLEGAAAASAAADATAAAAAASSAARAGANASAPPTPNPQPPTASPPMGPSPTTPSPTGVAGLPTPAAPPTTLPATAATPALGPLPRNAWAGGISAKRQSSYTSTASSASTASAPVSPGGALGGAPASAPLQASQGDASSSSSSSSSSSASASASAAATSGSAWESTAPEGIDEEDGFSLGEAAATAPTPTTTGATTPGAASNRTPPHSISLSRLPPALPLSRTLSSRRRAGLTGGGASSSLSGSAASSSSGSSSSGGGGGGASTPPSSPPAVIQALTCASTLVGKPTPQTLSGLDAHLLRKLRSLEMWGTRAALPLKELRSRCDSMAHAFAASVLHTVHTAEFPVLSPRVAAAGGSGSGSTGGSGGGSGGAPSSSPPAPPAHQPAAAAATAPGAAAFAPVVVEDDSASTAERAFVSGLSAFGTHWASAMGSAAVYHLVWRLVKTAGIVALAGSSSSSSGGASGGGGGFSLQPKDLPGARMAVQELQRRVQSLLACAVGAGALPPRAVRAGLARVLEEAHGTGDAALEAGAVGVLGQLLRNLQPTGVLGGAPFFPSALSPSVWAQVEGEWEGGEGPGEEGVSVITRVRLLASEVYGSVGGSS